MPKFRKKPVVIEAKQLHPVDRGSPCNCQEIVAWVGTGAFIVGEGVEISTLEGNMRAEPGDWIIKGVKGEFYPIKDEIFRETYESVE